MRRRKKKTADETPDVEASGDETPDVEASGDPGEQTEIPETKAAPAKLPHGWGNVVHDTLKIEDPAALAARLRAELTLDGDDLTNYALIVPALDKSAANLEAAGRLHRAAKVQEEALIAKLDADLAIMRDKAAAELNEEYQAKKRKSPTKQDVEDRMAENWPERYETIRKEKGDMHGTVRAFETLITSWNHRCSTLRIMADRARKN